MVQEFCAWLAQTPASDLVQRTRWMVPLVQTLHILSIGFVMFTTAKFSVQLAGLRRRQPSAPIEPSSTASLSWVWGALLVLALSGAVLIIGEPARELANPVFQAKMALIVVAAVLLATVQRVGARNPSVWTQRRVTARVVAMVSLALWVAILTAGRWIAYF